MAKLVAIKKRPNPGSYTNVVVANEYAMVTTGDGTEIRRLKLSSSELQPFSRYAPENSAPAAIRIHVP